MFKQFRARFIFLLGLLPATDGVLAHHSVHIHFDVSKDIVIEGVVSLVEFRSPHSYFYVKAPSPIGEMIEYEVESWSHTLLRRQGWNEDTIKVGDRIKIHAKAARKHKNRVFAAVFVLPSGEELRVNDNLPR